MSDEEVERILVQSTQRCSPLSEKLRVSPPTWRHSVQLETVASQMTHEIGKAKKYMASRMRPGNNTNKYKIISERRIMLWVGNSAASFVCNVRRGIVPSSRKYNVDSLDDKGKGSDSLNDGSCTGRQTVLLLSAGKPAKLDDQRRNESSTATARVFESSFGPRTVPYFAEFQIASTPTGGRYRIENGDIPVINRRTEQREHRSKSPPYKNVDEYMGSRSSTKTKKENVENTSRDIEHQQVTIVPNGAPELLTRLKQTRDPHPENNHASSWEVAKFSRMLRTVQIAADRGDDRDYREWREQTMNRAESQRMIERDRYTVYSTESTLTSPEVGCIGEFSGLRKVESVDGRGSKEQVVQGQNVGGWSGIGTTIWRSTSGCRTEAQHKKIISYGVNNAKLPCFHKRSDSPLTSIAWWLESRKLSERDGINITDAFTADKK
ncbi:hypothetical protein BD410DRAFT_807045 [Rickenella mellea]|uniref:Uncharacterized protein n=1 Tax=Rickenella mellea TaxID=50990 RepID=A0A4Y7PRY5_9AGAM|nr:hypothetical protein BD410DRAFT_807045 [Rickenella mellea]